MSELQSFSLSELVKRFFGVALEGRSYLNVAYLLLAFPLGIAYFIFLVTGLSLGLGLLILWVGLLILLVVIVISFGLSYLEGSLATHLLGADIESPIRRTDPTSGTLDDVKAFFSNKVTWTGMAFLLLKFPLGIVSFVLVVVGGAVSFALTAMPIFYRWDQPVIGFPGGYWTVDTLPEALVCTLIGVLCFLITLHAVNALAWVWRFLAESLLARRRRSMPSDPAPTPPAVAHSALA